MGLVGTRTKMNLIHSVHKDRHHFCIMRRPIVVISLNLLVDGLRLLLWIEISAIKLFNKWSCLKINIPVKRLWRLNILMFVRKTVNIIVISCLLPDSKLGVWID